MARFDLGGAGAGAASGAAAGSMFGPVGTGVGAVAGGLLGLFGRRKKKKLSTFDKTQQGLYDQYAQGLQGQGPFADMYNFDPDQTRDYFNRNYAQPAYEQFQENTIPQITGQFRAGNLQNSSYLGNALARSGRDVQRNLDNQLADILYKGQQDSIQRRINGLRDILGTQTFAYERNQPSSGDQLFSQLLNIGSDVSSRYINKRFGG